jgi:hypothetical protein
MGQVPNRYPVYISEIAAALGGAYDLAWYRGRQYWNAGGSLVTISGNAAMSEFPGITNDPPYLSAHTLASRWNGGSINGYDAGLQGVYGGLSPSGTPAGTCVGLWNDFATGQMWFVVSGVVGQVPFNYLEIVGVATLALGSASHFPGNYFAGFTVWVWSTGNILGAADYTMYCKN